MSHEYLGGLFRAEGGSFGVCLRNSKAANVVGAECMECGVSGGRKVPRSQLSESPECHCEISALALNEEEPVGVGAEEGCGKSWCYQGPSGSV